MPSVRRRSRVSDRCHKVSVRRRDSSPKVVLHMFRKVEHHRDSDRCQEMPRLPAGVRPWNGAVRKMCRQAQA